MIKKTMSRVSKMPTTTVKNKAYIFGSGIMDKSNAQKLKKNQKASSENAKKQIKNLKGFNI